MKRRDILAVLGLSFVFFVCGVMTCNAGTIESGECGANGNNLTWTNDGSGTLIISGSGKMRDFSNEMDPTRWGWEEITHIIVEEGVTSIGTNAFGYLSIDDITLPNSLESIGTNVFFRCSVGSEMQIPAGVKSIAENAFQCLQMPGNLTIPASVTTIGDGAFSDITDLQSVVVNCNVNIPKYMFCESKELKTVTINGSVTEIGEGAFDNCTSLKTINLPNGLKRIGEYAFDWCESMTNITIPKSVTEIGEDAFTSCRALKEITIPQSVEYIGDVAFFDCQNLETVIIEENSKLRTIGVSAFGNCFSLREVNSLPEGITVLPSELFFDCRNLESIVIPESVTTIEGHAFYQCSKLTSLVFPKNVKTIGGNACWSCTGLNTIYLPQSITFIDEGGFLECDNLSDVYYDGSKARWNAIDIVDPDSLNSNYYLTHANIHFKNEPEIYADDVIITISDVLGNTSLEAYVRSSNAMSYNPELSYLLAGLSRAAYDQQKLDSSLESMNYDMTEGQGVVHDYNDDCTAAYTIAKKTLSDGSEFVLITIRGSWGWSWSSNANIGAAALAGLGKHAGFEADATEIYNRLRDFAGIDTENMTYVITGHSQGAAAANLLAVKLYDNGVPSSNVYDYNYACPNVACLTNSNDWNPDRNHDSILDHDNIFNIGNVEDPVPLLPSNYVHKWIPLSGVTSTWGKFGQSYWFYPSSDNRSLAGHDMKYYLRALQQLEPITSFYTYWEIPHNLTKRFLGIHCPVDVVVYDTNGKPIASIINNQENYYDSEFGEVMILVDGDEKWIMLPEEKDYRVSLTATGSGEMKYEVYTADITNDSIIDEKSFENVQLTDGKKFASDIDNDKEVADSMLYVVDENENILAEVQVDGTETDHICAHSWNTTYTVDSPATCTKEGSESLHCSKCGAKKEGSSRAIAKTSHRYSEWKTTKNATEISKGQQTRKCAVCGSEDMQEIAPLAPTLKAVKISKPKAAKKAATIKWKKISKKNLKKIKKVQIQYSLDKTFMTGVKTKLAEAKKTSYKIKGLKKGKKYYVRVRAYTKSGNAVHVSKWSAKKSVKAK